VRGRGALSGGSTRGARGAGAEPSGAGICGFESFRELPQLMPMRKHGGRSAATLEIKKRKSGILPTPKGVSLNAANKKIGKQSGEAQLLAIHVLKAPPWIAPQLRAQGRVEARRQNVAPILCGHAAKDRLAVRRDAAARRQWLAAVGARAAEVLVLKIGPAAATRRAATSPVPATDPEHSEPGGAGVRGRGALSGGSTLEGRAGRILKGATRQSHDRYFLFCIEDSKQRD
jgi:hypothetical protein